MPWVTNNSHPLTISVTSSHYLNKQNVPAMRVRSPLLFGNFSLLTPTLCGLWCSSTCSPSRDKIENSEAKLDKVQDEVRSRELRSHYESSISSISQFTFITDLPISTYFLSLFSTFCWFIIMRASQQYLVIAGIIPPSPPLIKKSISPSHL